MAVAMGSILEWRRSSFKYRTATSSFKYIYSIFSGFLTSKEGENKKEKEEDMEQEEGEKGREEVKLLQDMDLVFLEPKGGASVYLEEE